jgi:hypothetical protein
MEKEINDIKTSRALGDSDDDEDESAKPKEEDE